MDSIKKSSKLKSVLFGQRAFLLIPVLIMLSNAFSQTNSRETLVEHIADQCTILFASNPEKCNALNKEVLVVKLQEAELFLTAELEKMILVDSSTYYEETAEKVGSLEKAVKKRNKPKQKTELEKAYLRLSLLKPWQSDSLFIKLIHSYYDISPVAYQVMKPACFLTYKIWLLELLENRFRSETDSFSKYVCTLYFNQIIPFLETPFSGIEAEQALILHLDRLAVKATKKNLINYHYADLMIRIYETRAYKALEKYPKMRSAALFLLIEDFYLKAIALSSDKSQLNYTLGVHYYNEAIYLSSEFTQNETADETKQRQNRIAYLTEKSLTLMNGKN